ncbi:YheD [Alkaliphilus metalliredigens QYMF]|uniref:YheD n=1 Tax=Alkaliphilus metalliredigens (strain QYMF) TaxID=293826 RepID=A6TTQ8_ALKMQ|nr:YheC/YheD family protein [Alkaliphilus metalliredigens]ABR49576.1 YheD [Alkaliphilus metalliredigens QYMF]
MKRKPLIGILVGNSKIRPSSYFLYNQSKVNLFCFTRSAINWSNMTISGLFLDNNQWKRGTFPFPDAVYNRLYNKSLRNVIKKISKQIGQEKVFNTFNHLDKWCVYGILNGSSLKNQLPNTFLYNEVNLIDSLQSHQQMILKPRYGNLGRNIYSIEMKDDGDLYLYRQTTRPHLIFKDPSAFLEKINSLIDCKKYILQKKIEIANVNQRIFDIRTLVQKNKYGQWRVTGTLSRIAVRNFYITNVSHDVKSVEETLLQAGMNYENVIEQIIKISLETAKCLDGKLGLMGEIGIDLCLDYEEKPWILEVNGKPMKSLFTQLNDEKVVERVFSTPIEYATFLSRIKN